MKRLTYALLLILSCVTMSCTSPLPEETVIESADINSAVVAQPVEFGASLETWDEAMESENDLVKATITPAAEPIPSDDLIKATITPAAEPIPSSDAAYPIPTIDTAELIPSSDAAYPVPTIDAAYPVPTSEPVNQTLISPIVLTPPVDQDGYSEIMWDSLIPPNYTSDAIVNKYADQLSTMSDDAEGATELYEQMQAELNNAPVNETLDGTLIKLPGFIAPLEYEDDLITEFLLVPYFGACIHVPAPPVNQTILVKAAAGAGIKTKDSYIPIWIKGVLTTESTSTELAESGYYMENAIIEPYE